MGKTRMEIDKVLLDVIYEHTIHTTWRGVNRDLEEMNVMYGRYRDLPRIRPPYSA